MQTKVSLTNQTAFEFYLENPASAWQVGRKPAASRPHSSPSPCLPTYTFGHTVLSSCFCLTRWCSGLSREPSCISRRISLAPPRVSTPLWRLCPCCFLPGLFRAFFFFFGVVCGLPSLPPNSLQGWETTSLCKFVLSALLSRCSSVLVLSRHSVNREEEAGSLCGSLPAPM